MQESAGCGFLSHTDGSGVKLLRSSHALRQSEADALIDAFTIRTLTNAETLTQIIDQSLQRTREVIHPFPQANADSQVTALKQKDNRCLDAYEVGAMTLNELRVRRETIKTQIASLQRRTNDQEQPRDVSTEEFARKIVRGAFRFKRMTDPKEKKAIILSLFQDLYIKDRSIIAFKFRDDFELRAQQEPGDGFATTPIHLDTGGRASDCVGEELRNNSASPRLK
jgi:hypothetical protein